MQNRIQKIFSLQKHPKLKVAKCFVISFDACIHEMCNKCFPAISVDTLVALRWLESFSV